MRDHARFHSRFPLPMLKSLSIKVAIGGAKSKLLSAVLNHAKLLSAMFKLLWPMLNLLLAVKVEKRLSGPL